MNRSRQLSPRAEKSSVSKKMQTPLVVKREINLNTIAIIVGFLITFAGIIGSWSNLQNQQLNFVDFIVEQKGFNSRVDERIKATEDHLSELPQFTMQIAAITENAKGIDERLSRMTESYSNRFSDIQNQLATLVTQIALIKQSLDRIEAWRSLDRQSARDGSGQPQR